MRLRLNPLACASLLAVGSLTGCSLPWPGPAATRGPDPSPQAVAACNTRADEEFSVQNRGAVYQSDRYASSIRDSPFSAQGLPGTTTASLSNRYERDQDVRSCLNGTATPIEPAGAKHP